MSRVVRVDVPKYHQGKEEGTYPRMIRRYSNPHNPTFKSHQFETAIWQSGYVKPVPKIQPQIHQQKIQKITKITTPQSLDVATHQFDMKRSLLFQKSPEELHLLTNNFSGRRTPRLQIKNSDDYAHRETTQYDKRFISRSSLGRYNDASVYSWQSKPYNIISNFSKEVDVLRASKFGNPQQSYARSYFNR